MKSFPFVWSVQQLVPRQKKWASALPAYTLPTYIINTPFDINAGWEKEWIQGERCAKMSNQLLKKKKHASMQPASQPMALVRKRLGECCAGG